MTDCNCIDNCSMIQTLNISTKSLEEVPGLHEAMLQTIKEESLIPFCKACPFENKKSEEYVNSIDPEFIAKTFVLKSVMKPCITPKCLADELQTVGYITPTEIDTSFEELMLLEVMGYTRWNEVKSYCEELKSGKLFEMKLFMRRRLNII